jgi:hypothetical protein
VFKFFSLCVLMAYPAMGAQLLEPGRLELTSSNAVVHWVTDVPTGTRVQVNPSSATVTVLDPSHPVTNHTATISGLHAGARYEIKLGTARQWLATTSVTAIAAPASEPRLHPHHPQPPAKSAVSEAPPTRKTWANLASLPDHFHRHGADFGAKDADDYARMAWEFLQRARVEGLPAKLDEDGVLRVFDPRTHTFAAYNRDGTTKTFFKARSPGYFDRQPGRLVNLKQPK